VKEKCRYFNESVAIITGAASGIGKALAEEMAKQGATVILADRQAELVQEVAMKIQEQGGKAAFYELDVRDFLQVERFVCKIAEEYGRLDFMFNNAGISISGPTKTYEIEDWYQIIDVNLKGVIHGVHAAYQLMVKQGFGHIVNTSSIAGVIPTPGQVSYATTKYAIVGLSKALRAEALLEGIQVSVLCPGVIKTPILKGAGKYGKDLSNLPETFVEQLVEKLRPMDPNIFAIKVLKDLSRNKMVIIYPSWWKIMWWIERLNQNLSLWLVKKNLQTFSKAQIPLKE